MNSDLEPGHSEWLKLLALKRHEQPPPGYFDHFADKVLARIEAAESARQTSWWQRLLTQFDAKPIVACAYGVALGALLVGGFGFVSLSDGSPTSLLSGTEGLASVTAFGDSLGIVPDLLALPVADRQASAGMMEPLAGSSMNPVTLGPPAFLLQTPGMNVVPASSPRNW